MANKTAAVTAPAGMDQLSTELLELLQGQDPKVARILADEAQRQATTLELIASENHVSPAVMHAMGNWMTNKYAEGYPGARYYGGGGWPDEGEGLPRGRGGKVLCCRLSHLQPHQHGRGCWRERGEIYVVAV